jgi:hypothetical protein
MEPSTLDLRPVSEGPFTNGRGEGTNAMESPIGPGAVGMNLENIKVCARCGLRYDWRKSPSSSLKMTYCSSLCEKADLGFTLEALLRYQKAEAPEPAAPAV